ncbi:hypothetical protein I7I48_08102 [Histoplasma ohiense]|nr:hypothetical protein I7I48_08102 [Histoplasma ohiense (nom. inval.)]
MGHGPWTMGMLTLARSRFLNIWLSEETTLLPMVKMLAAMFDGLNPSWPHFIMGVH